MANKILLSLKDFIDDYYENNHIFKASIFLGILDDVFSKMGSFDKSTVLEMNNHLVEVTGAFERKDYYYIIDYLENVFIKSDIINLLGD